MKRKIVYAICLFGILSACKDEKEERTVKFPVNVKAFVRMYDQFGTYKTDGLGGTIVAMKAGTTFTATGETNADGLCNLQATTGTYHFECARNGYGPVVTSAYQILGGDASYPVYMNLFEVSGTRFEGVALSIAGTQMTVNATVYHSYPYVINGGYSPVQGVIFLSTSPDVSPVNYMRTVSFPVMVLNGKTAATSFYLATDLFPGGSTVYTKIYGVAYNDDGNYNVRTGKYTYTTLGPASATAEILVP